MAGSKLTPKIILEGTRLTFKTEIAFALNDHPRIVGPKKYQYHSPVISAEWCTFTNYPWGRGPINFEPQEAEKAMEVYETWVHMFELQRYYSWIIDRFHISTKAYQLRKYGTNYDFAALEERMKTIGFHLVFCTRDPDSFSCARERRLKVSGKPDQYDDLGHFVEEQNLMRRLIDASVLPTLILDVSDNSIENATDKIADWMEETGGLYSED